MTQLTIQIPDDVADTLFAEAERRHMTPEQMAAEQIAKMLNATSPEPHRSYASFFGAAKGQLDSHGSKEAIDSYLSALRQEW